MSTATPLPPLGGRGGPAADAPAGGRRRRLVRARAGVPAWERPALAALLLGTLVLYLWELGREGWANSYYAAAVQAGTESWKAFLFGSLDASNFITVDKPPASLWLMELSGRVFGVNAWSMLVPQAIAGVLTVWLTYRIVRRWFDAPAALLAGAALALTPVAALMFRFNNPDALLTLLLVAGAYALVRAVEAGATTWLVLAGALVGTAFLAKSLQAFLVVPAFALVWMLAAPGPLGRRALRMLAGAGALVAASAWWVAAVELTPASARPYIGGSDDNSVLSLIFGYNGLDRLSGGGGPGGGANFSGDPGVGRLFNTQMGGQIAWLLPFAAVALAAGIWSRRGTPRTDRRRAAYVLWGGWAVTHALVFSAMSGIVHSYYTVAMAPAVAALSGMGAVDMWRMRGDARTRWVLPLAVGASAVTAYVLLDRSPGFVPALKWLVLLGGLAAAIGLLVDGDRPPARAAVALAAVAAVAVLAGPAAYAVQTAGTSHQGSTPSAGPAVTGAMGGFDGGIRGGFPGGGAMPQGAPPQGAMSQSAPPQGAMPQGGAFPQGAMAPQSGGGPGMATVGDDVVAFLEANRGDARWIAATDGANAAAGIQLASGEPVMAIGGFSGRDPAPTLDEFVALVREGAVRYYVGGGGSGIPGMGAGDTSIAAWVQDHGTLVDTSLTGGATVYDLSGAAG
ncbi:MAG TPA: glycosyltransferase family 39 protein [Miltoncostaeaceae bacterium]|nr:glycosyltransferase family 39 protein [Miltoncostaeaceae bacterium]